MRDIIKNEKSTVIDGVGNGVTKMAGVAGIGKMAPGAVIAG